MKIGAYLGLRPFNSLVEELELFSEIDFDGLCLWPYYQRSTLADFESLSHRQSEVEPEAVYTEQFYLPKHRILSREGRRQLAKVIQDSGIELFAMQGHNLLEADVNFNADIIDLAAELEIPYVNFITGAWYGSMYWERLWERYKENWEGALYGILVDMLTRLAEYANARGITLTLETHFHSIVDSPGKTKWVLEKVDSPTLKTYLDGSHLFFLNIDFSYAIKTLKPWLVLAACKGCLEKRLDSLSELVGGARSIWTAPGAEGDIFPFDEWASALHREGYDGYINAELFPWPENREKIAYEYMNERLSQIGLR